MCSSSPPIQLPATPPPPPPVLEQDAPQQASPTTSDNLKKQATGTRQYRTGLSIGGAQTSSTNNGLGISQ